MLNPCSALFRFTALFLCVSLVSSSLGASLSAIFKQESRPNENPAAIVERPNPGEFYYKPTNKVRRTVTNKGYGRATRAGLWTEKSLRAIQSIGEEKPTDSLWSLNAAAIDSPPPSGTAAGSGFPWEGAMGDVNTATGNKLTSVDIIGWPSRGDLRVDLAFHHSSRFFTQIQHHMTDGWSLSYDIRAFEKADGSNLLGFVIWGDGTVYPYGAKDGSGVYARPTGIFDDLQRNGNGTFTLTMKNQWKYEFNANGLCTQIKDRWGHTLTITWASYSQGGTTYYQVASVADPDGRTLTFTYDGTTKRLTTVTTSFDSRTWNVLYTGNNLTKVEWPLLSGQQNRSYREFGYSSNRITSDRSLRGKTTTYTYTTDGELETETTPMGFVTDYDYFGGVTTITLPKPSTIQQTRQIVHTYSNGRLEEVTDEAGFVKSYTYNSSNLMTSYVDPFTNTWSTTSYDGNGNPTETYGPATDYHHTYTYNSTNDLTSVTNGENIKTVYEYYGPNDSDGPEGALKLIKTRTQATPSEQFQTRQTFTYYTSASDKGQLKTIKDGSNFVTQIAYTTKGEVSTITKPDGTVTSFSSHGHLSNLQTLVEPSGVSTTIGYDNWYRPITTTQGSAVVTTEYLDDGLIASTTLSGSDLPQSNASQVTSYAYDNDSRPTSKTDANGQTEAYAYTNSPWLTAITNTRNCTRNYTYNLRGEVRLLTMPDSTHEKWTYNGTGKVSSYSVGKFVGMTLHEFTIDYEYDDLQRLSVVNYNDDDPNAVDTTFTYDWADRMTQMVDASGTTTWEYYPTDLVKKITTPNGNTEYTYNNNDTRATLVTAEGTTEYDYDAYGRPEWVKNPSKRLLSISFILLV